MPPGPPGSQGLLLATDLGEIVPVCIRINTAQPSPKKRFGNGKGGGGGGCRNRGDPHQQNLFLQKTFTNLTILHSEDEENDEEDY